MAENILGPKEVDLSVPAQDNRFSPLNDFPLKQTPFRSRATWEYATGRNIKFINFADHRSLQASELNELQEHYVSAQSLQLRFNANWKNSSYGVIPSWTGIMPLDPNSIIVYDPEVIDSDTVRLKFFLSRGWYLTRRKSNDKLNRWIYISDDIDVEFNYINELPTYEMYLGFNTHTYTTKCCNVGDCTSMPTFDPSLWQEQFSQEYRDNSQDYVNETQNENTCGADRNGVGLVDDAEWPSNTSTDQTLFGFSETNDTLASVLALFKIIRNDDQYEIRYPNDLLVAGDLNLGLPSTKVFTTNGLDSGNLAISYGTWQTIGLPPEQGGVLGIQNEGGLVNFSNGYVVLSTKKTGVPAEVSGSLGSSNSRAEIRLDGAYTAPWFTRKTILGYQKFDVRLKARVKLETPLHTHLFIVGMYKTHAASHSDFVLGEAAGGRGYFFGAEAQTAGMERIIGFVNTLEEGVSPTWSCLVMDGCLGNGRGYSEGFSSYEIFHTGFSCLDEHLLEVYMNKEETFIQFKVDGVTIKTYENANGLLCIQPRPKNSSNRIQRSLNIGCAVRDIADPDRRPGSPSESPNEGIMKINDLSVTLRSVVPFESLSYPQNWNL